MGERNAKKNKKENQAPVMAPKKSTGEKVFIIVIVVIGLVIAGLGGYAIFEKIKKDKADQQAFEQLQQQLQQQAEQQETVETIASGEGLSVEEYLKKIGLEDSGLTGKSTAQELWSKLTIENYALMKDLDVNEFKAMYGIEKLENTMLWSEAELKVPMGKVAEVEYGITFEQFATENSLPEAITAETTFEEALAIMEAQAAADAETEAETETETEAE